MKKFINIASMVLVIALACSFVFLIGYGFLSKSLFNDKGLVEANRKKEQTVPTTEEEESLIFYSIDEYNEYIQSQSTVSITDDEMHAGVNLVSLAAEVPSANALPSDAVLNAIEVDNSSTSFIYNLNRVRPLAFETDDTTLMALTQTMIQQELNVGYNPRIQDLKVYAADLAEKIGAEYSATYGKFDAYVGDVYVSLTNSETGEIESVRVGYQVIRCGSSTNDANNIDKVMYFYYPITLSAQEINAFVGMELHSIANNIE